MTSEMSQQSAVQPAPRPVLILGGGPVGLTAALELARFHVPTIVFEKHPGTSWHPKTRNFNTRSMEITAGWGRAVYARMRSIDTPPGWKTPIRFLATANGEQFGMIDSSGFEGPGPDISPALPVMSSQDYIETILWDAARATGIIDLRFNHVVNDIVRGGSNDDIDAALSVTDKATGETSTVVGSALVAADGAASLAREQLGVELIGDKEFSHVINCYFRADIESHLDGRSGVLLFVISAKAAGVFQPLDAKGRWLCQIGVSRAEFDADVFDAARCRQWVRDGAGVADLDVEILSIGKWQMNATVAETLVRGRVVFCGDSAHQFPPTGGLGVNTGIQGMHNVMWKLAMFVQGHAGRGLIDTYDTERRPVAVTTTAQSLQNHRNVGSIALAAALGTEADIPTASIVETSRRYGNHLGVEFGSFYSSTAIIPDGTDPPAVEDPYTDYVQSATPGCRAPHLWLGQGADAFSTLDLFGPGFTLLISGLISGLSPGLSAGVTRADPSAWTSAVDVGRRLGVSLAVYAIGSAGLADRDGTFLALYGIDQDGAVLVRPDGYVAWRSAKATDDAEQTLTAVLTRLLHRD